MEKTNYTFMKKIVLTGPESSGKSTLLKDIENKIGLHGVPEYSRIYIDELKRPYVKDDLLEMAKGQLELESSLRKKNNQVLLCDTDLLTIKIWSEFKYGSCETYILDQLNNNLPDLYLLTTPEMPWEPDPQREYPTDRDKLFEIFKQEIIRLKIPYEVLKGDPFQRLDQFLKLTREFL
jgi:NadR type nicotinamide-nucleotide adenylyltransferase